MPARDALDRVAIARIAAETKWGVTPNRTQATAKARAALAEKFLRSADGDPVRAEHLRRAHYLRLARKSAEARRKIKEQTAEAEAAEAELAGGDVA